MTDKRPTAPLSIRISDKERKLIEAMKEEYGVDTAAEVVRRSVAQASFLNDLADEDGSLTIKRADGTEFVVPLKI